MVQRYKFISKKTYFEMQIRFPPMKTSTENFLVMGQTGSLFVWQRGKKGLFFLYTRLKKNE